MITLPVAPLQSHHDDVVSVSFYNAAGDIVGRYTGPRSMLAQNTPAGCSVMDGNHDPRECRVNAQGEVEQRPQAEIDAALAAVNADIRRGRIREAMKDVEIAQARAMREFTIGRGGTQQELKARLEAIDDRLAGLRVLLNE